MTDEKEIKPTVILKKFFEMKPDQDLKGFLAELKELSDEEKMQLAIGINNGTFTY